MVHICCEIYPLQKSYLRFNALLRVHFNMHNSPKTNQKHNKRKNFSSTIFSNFPFNLSFLCHTMCIHRVLVCLYLIVFVAAETNDVSVVKGQKKSIKFTKQQTREFPSFFTFSILYHFLFNTNALSTVEIFPILTVSSAEIFLAF